MEINSRQSQSGDRSRDDTSVSRLLFPAKKKEDVVHARDATTKGERVPTGAATLKRKTPASAGGRPSTAKRPRTQNSTSAPPGPASRGRSELGFSPEETERWIDIILECRADRLLIPNGVRQIGRAWDRIVEAFAREFPEKKWTRETMEAKLRTETRRCDQFLRALKILGASYSEPYVEEEEEETDMIVKHYPDALRPQNKALSDPYEDMLSQETFITGQEIDPITPREYSDEEDLTTDDEDLIPELDDFPPREDHDNDDLSSDIDELSSDIYELIPDDESWPGDRQVSRFSRIREDSGDPDLAIENGTASAILRGLPEIPLLSLARRRPLESTIATLANSRMDPATQPSKTLESNPVVMATKDMVARYQGKKGQPGKYSLETVSRCLENFEENRLSAVIWNALPDCLKDKRMADWASKLEEK